MVNRIAVATTAALLILELVLAAVVITGMAVRRPVSRAMASVREKVARPRPASRPVERRA